MNSKSYVGSSVNLGRRIQYYYSFRHITDPKYKMLIHKALLKYGYSNFKLEILEYCEPLVVLNREQFYLDLLKPEYNILKVAGSRLGYKHTEETKAKIREIASKEKRLKHILSLNVARGHPIEVTNTKTNETTIYTSLRAAETQLGISRSTITRYVKNKKEYKTYKFTLATKK